MSHPLAVFIMMSNYFHDVATAMVMASSIALWVIMKFFEGSASPDAVDFLLRLYRGISKLVVFSWAWIFSAGLIRLFTFRIYEWPNAVAKNQEYGLMVKYCLALGMMAGGAWLWYVVAARMRALAPAHQAD